MPQENNNSQFIFYSNDNKVSIEGGGENWKIKVNDSYLKDEGEQEFSGSKEDMRSEALKYGYSQANGNLKKILTTENLIILTGAGASRGENGTGGKLMNKLWDQVEADLKFNIGGVDKTFGDVLSLANHEPNEKDLEGLLSELQIEKQSKENQGNDFSTIETAIQGIEKIITKECSFRLSDVEGVPHADFLRNLLRARKKTDPRLKIFSLNYDRLFEEAGDYIGATIIDGFSLTQGRRFNGTNFDLDIVHRERTRIRNEENFYQKVFHLYKIHGSIDWTERNSEIIKREDGLGDDEKPLLIYPNFSKFESSYEMPFFEMMSRFQMTLRKQNICLVVIGYGFNDEHINRVIEEAIKTNVNLKVIIISSSIHTDDEAEGNQFRKKIFKLIKDGFNGIMLVADNFNNFSKKIPQISIEDVEEEKEKMLNNLK